MSDPLGLYLHDHLAGSRFAVELLERIAREFEGTRPGDTASVLMKEIEEDRAALEQLIGAVGDVQQHLYDALGWVAERLSRLKLQRDDPFGIGVFEAFETVSLGILGKRCLWEALKTCQIVDARVAGPDYDDLLNRAERQFQQANKFRLDLVQSALTRTEKVPGSL